jgi:hypothetical protein
MLRALGDAYVREEFRRHKNASPPYVYQFMAEWMWYLSTLKAQQERFGVDLDPMDISKLDSHQQEQLAKLRTEARRLIATEDRERKGSAA